MHVSELHGIDLYRLWFGHQIPERENQNHLETHHRMSQLLVAIGETKIQDGSVSCINLSKNVHEESESIVRFIQK